MLAHDRLLSAVSRELRTTVNDLPAAVSGLQERLKTANAKLARCAVRS